MTTTTPHLALFDATPQIDREITFLRPEAVSLESHHERVAVDVQLSGKLGDRHPLALVIHKAIIAAVVFLLLPCCPSAVLRRVGTVYVYTVKRMIAAWLRPHVSNKGREVVAPSVTDSDSTPTVMRKASHARLMASASSVVPRAILRRVPSISVLARSVSVFQQSRGVHLGAQAVATCALAAQQIARIKLFFASAVAFANPSTRTGLLNNNETAIALSRSQLAWCHHMIIGQNTHYHTGIK